MHSSTLYVLWNIYEGLWFFLSVSFFTNTVLREQQEIKLMFCICYIYVSSISISFWQHVFF